MDAESQLLAEKDAEIERLKSLITELCDAIPIQIGKHTSELQSPC